MRKFSYDTAVRGQEISKEDYYEQLNMLPPISIRRGRGVSDQRAPKSRRGFKDWAVARTVRYIYLQQRTLLFPGIQFRR